MLNSYNWPAVRDTRAQSTSPALSMRLDRVPPTVSAPVVLLSAGRSDVVVVVVAVEVLCPETATVYVPVLLP